jgi:hypothetical protein
VGQTNTHKEIIMSHQTEQTHREPEVTTRSDQKHPTERATGARQQRGRIAMAIATIAIGGGLTALVTGVTGDEGSGTEAPPNPGFQLPYQNELPPKGLDQRLYNLAEESQRPLACVASSCWSGVPPKGLEQRLYSLAEERAAERQAEMQLAPGADLRLYNLAEERAAERRAEMQLAPGADQRLDNLADMLAAKRHAR